MAFCTKCGEQNTDIAQFCVKCGNQMGAMNSSASGSVASSESQTFVVELIRSLYPGSKTICVSAVVIIISFFLPYYGNGANAVTVGGLWWLMPIYALLAVGLAYLTHIGEMSAKLFSTAATIAIAMLYAPQILIIFRGGNEIAGFGIGFYGISLGFLAMVVGAFLNLWSITKEMET
ncbi:MAG: zinc-ribbon domain-containing protein [Actinomycetota bacterium]